MLALTDAFRLNLNPLDGALAGNAPLGLVESSFEKMLFYFCSSPLLVADFSREKDPHP
jgi:hypothetical protein